MKIFKSLKIETVVVLIYYKRGRIFCGFGYFIKRYGLLFYDLLLYRFLFLSKRGFIGFKVDFVDKIFFKLRKEEELEGNIYI